MKYILTYFIVFLSLSFTTNAHPKERMPWELSEPERRALIEEAESSSEKIRELVKPRLLPCLDSDKAVNVQKEQELRRCIDLNGNNFLYLLNERLRYTKNVYGTVKIHLYFDSQSKLASAQLAEPTPIDEVLITNLINTLKGISYPASLANYDAVYTFNFLNQN